MLALGLQACLSRLCFPGPPEQRRANLRGGEDLKLSASVAGILVHCWSTKALWTASEWVWLRATKTMLPDLGFGLDGATAVLRLPVRWMRQQFEAWYQDLLDLVKPVWRTLARGQACLWGQRYYSSVPSPDNLAGGLDPACTERSLGPPEIVCCGWEGASW